MKINSTKSGYVARAIPAFGSMAMFIIGCVFNPLFGLSAGTLLLLGGVAGFRVVEHVMSLFYRTDLDKYFGDSGAEVKRSIKTDTGVEYHVKLPAGMSSLDVEKQIPAIEQYLGSSVSLRFDYDEKQLILTSTKKRLESFYAFELVQTDNPLEVCLGYDVDGRITLNLEECPHLLIAGTTGSGKSVLLRSILCGFILTKPDSILDIHLVDFLKIELGIFKKSSKVKSFCSEPSDFALLLAKLKKESDIRLDLFDAEGVVNISTYNKHAKKKLKYIVVVVDEFAALAEDKAIMTALKLRIAQDRKCGIHYIICTQRPSVDVIQGTIKANIPARIALQTATDTDSKVILDETGAADLKGKGHAILKTSGKKEFQGMYLSETEAYKLVEPTFKEVKREVAKKRQVDRKIY